MSTGVPVSTSTVVTLINCACFEDDVCQDGERWGDRMYYVVYIQRERERVIELICNLRARELIYYVIY